MRGTDLIRLQRNLHMCDSQPSPATTLAHREMRKRVSPRPGFQ